MANGRKVRWLVWFPEESFTFLKPAADGLLKLAQSSNGPTRFVWGGTSNFNIWHGQVMAGKLELIYMSLLPQVLDSVIGGLRFLKVLGTPKLRTNARRTMRSDNDNSDMKHDCMCFFLFVIIAITSYDHYSLTQPIIEGLGPFRASFLGLYKKKC